MKKCFYLKQEEKGSLISKTKFKKAKYIAGLGFKKSDISLDQLARAPNTSECFNSVFLRMIIFATVGLRS